MAIAVLGIDLGQNSCSLVGLDEAGAVIKRRRIRPEISPPSPNRCRPASWLWRRAVARITSDGC
jgi:sugar (pentulose or hexulose) kinase